MPKLEGADVGTVCGMFNTMPMSDVRYCIFCATQINDAAYCTNPDCGAPNFYRNVSMPRREREEGGQTPGAAKTGSGGATSAAVLHQGDIATPRDVAESSPERHTMQMQAQPIAFLRSVNHPNEEHVIALGTTTVGARRPAGVIVDHPEVSSKHAQFDCRTDEEGNYDLTVIDCDSTNGTYLNGDRVERGTVQDGDTISFAGVEYELHLIDQGGGRMTMPMGGGIS